MGISPCECTSRLYLALQLGLKMSKTKVVPLSIEENAWKSNETKFSESAFDGG